MNEEGEVIKGFQLCFETERMRNKLKQNNTHLLLDSTHGLNYNRFETFNAMGISQFGDGVPASHLITQQAREVDLLEWLTHIKEVVEESLGGERWQPMIIIDMSEAELNAIRTVFGEDVKVLFCSWHVLRAWIKVRVVFVPP